MKIFLVPKANWLYALFDAINTGLDNDMIIVNSYDQLELATSAHARMRARNRVNDIRFAELNTFTTQLHKTGIPKVNLVAGEWIEV
jgi:hypothetical protein